MLLIDHVANCYKSEIFHVLSITFKEKLQHVGHKWVTSGLLYGSVGQVGQQV